MTIKVLIKRKFSEHHSQEVSVLLVNLRSLAMKQQGYIGGETLKRVDKPGEYLVISRWQGLEDWSRWFVSNDRRDIQERIDTLIGSETHFEIYSN